MDDIGEYSCEADNAVGTIVASGMLLVHCEYNKLIFVEGMGNLGSDLFNF